MAGVTGEVKMEKGGEEREAALEEEEEEEEVGKVGG